MRTACLGLLAVLICNGSVSVRAQEVTGSLEGRVLDSNGNPLAGAEVVAESPVLLGTRDTTTDARGRFQLPVLPIGQYAIRVSHVAHRETLLERVTVLLGTATFVGEIRLQARMLEMEPIVVIADAARIDPTTAASGDNLSRDTFERLPTERDYRSILALLPQANVSYLGDEINIAGATGLENVYYIDGINVTDPYRSRTGTNLPYDFVEEVQLKTGGYEAEFGRAMGGIVNVVTGSGSNEFRGSVFGYYTNDALAGDAKFGVIESEIDGLANRDLGFSVSGPIVRDRLWYSVAVDRAVSDQDVAVPDFGFVNDELTADTFAGKLSWKVGAGTDLIFSVIGDPTKHDVVGPRANTLASYPAGLVNIDPVLASTESGGINLAISSRTFVNSRFLIEASIARNARKESSEGATEIGRDEPLFIDSTTGFWEGGRGSRGGGDTERIAANFSATLFRGRHTFKAGAQLEQNSLDALNAYTEPGVITKYSDTSYRALWFYQQSNVEDRIAGLFVQDSWKIGERWRLNYGLRWDGTYVYGDEGDLAQSFTNQYQPRIGFTWTPGQPGTHKVSGSIGRYYQQLPTYLYGLIYSGLENWVRFYDMDPRIDPDAFLSEIVFTTDSYAAARPGIEGEFLDEVTLGYERTLGSSYLVSARGTFRTLGNAFRTGILPGTFTIRPGNPGSGELSFLPEVKRDYTSLELVLNRTGGSRLNFGASYVWSRNVGNTPGLFDSDTRAARPNNNINMRLIEQVPNSDGLLPNDRTHVAKVFGSYRCGRGITLGLFGVWASGTPLNEFGASYVGFNHNVFLVERGSAGRTPSIWDLNLRFQWTIGKTRAVVPRLTVDVLHLASQTEVTAIDQVRYQGLDNGNQAFPNPNFGAGVAYQPPAMVRIGIELGF